MYVIVHVNRVSGEWGISCVVENEAQVCNVVKDLEGEEPEKIYFPQRVSVR